MNKLIIIAAIGKNNELGKNNDLIWHLPNDLKFFKENTTGCPIIMGYNTYKSLPRLLPGRKHIVLTHQEITLPEEVDVFHDKESLMKSLSKYESNIFVIGGSSIYKQFLNNADELLLTEIDATDSKADVFFPKFDKNNYTYTFLKENEDNGIKYKHAKYVKI